MIYQVIVIAIAVGGLVLIAVTGRHLGEARHLKESVLVTRRFSNSQVNQIRHAVRRSGELPLDPTLHAATIAWAREELTYGPYTYGWIVWQFVGTAAVASAFYLIPGLVVDIVVAIVQVLLVLTGWGATRYARQGRVPAAALVAKHVTNGPEELVPRVSE